MKHNPIPLTLALAPFDRLGTISMVDAKLASLAAQLDKAEDQISQSFDASMPRTIEAYRALITPAEDIRAEIDALKPLQDLINASAGDTIFLSTHAYSLLAS